MTNFDRNAPSCFRGFLRASAAVGIACLLVLGSSRRASAVGLVYVDANDGATAGPQNLTPSAGGLLSDALDSTQSINTDNKWGYRSPFGSGGIIFEAGTTQNPGEENAPELKMTIDTSNGLISGSSYDIYVVYWSANGQNWTLKGGLSSGSHTLFNRTGPITFLPAAVAGIPAGNAVWTTPPSVKTEADRTMYLGKVGTATATDGQVNVFIDDLPTNAFPDSSGANAFVYRSWLDGVAFIESGVGITLNATIDRTNGSIKFSGPTGQNVNIVSYSINSAAGALNPTTWTPISSNYDGNDGSEFDTDLWNVTAPAAMPFPVAATALSEAEDASGSNTGGALTPAGVDLGPAWIRTPFQDVTISVTLPDASVVNIVPQYTGNAIVSGDLDADGDIDLTDFNKLVTHMHTDVSTSTRAQAYGLGDMTNDLAVNFADFVAFRTAYNSVHGAGAFEAATGIPEPAAALLFALAAGLCVCFRCRRGQTNPFNDFVPQPTMTRPTDIFWSGSQMFRPILMPILAMLAVLAGAVPTDAQLVTGWGIETNIAGATLTEGVAGSFTTTTPSGNAGPRALFPSVDFTEVGDIIQLSGTVNLPNTFGNQQFRYGLYNTNGKAQGTLASGAWSGADPTGWLGYMSQIGNAAGQDSIKGRNVTGDQWLANAGTFTVGNFTTGGVSPPGNVAYNFRLKLTRASANSVRTDYSFVGGTVNRSGTALDNNLGASSTMTSFNAVGFLLNGNTGAGTFSNVSVTQPKELRLRVNTTTGGISIVNSTDVPFDLSYYEIRSTAGSLNLTNWNSLDDQEGTDPVGTGWDEAGGSSANILSETNLLGKTSLSPTNTANLGAGFNIGGTQDVTFSYGLFNEATLTTAFVEYVSGGVPGDYNQNNIVDVADYVVWRKSVGLGTIPNRGSGIAGNVGQADYNFWKSHFGAVTGSGSGAAIAASAIPEPATITLIALCLMSGGCRRRNRRFV